MLTLIFSYEEQNGCVLEETLHCGAFDQGGIRECRSWQLGKSGMHNNADSDRRLINIQCKAATCSQCKTIMYPGPTGSPENHKKGYCSDGVKQVLKSDTVPDWPQPQGIFEMGMTFYLLKFLATIRNVYEKFVIKQGNGGNLAMEYKAFGKLLNHRIISPNNHFLFKLFDLEMPASTPPELVIDYNCARYLKVDCL